MSDLLAVAEQFSSGRPVIDVREFGSGNIHNTYLVTTDDPADKHFILQRINTNVFHRPDLVMKNIRICTGHITEKLGTQLLFRGARWEIPRVLPARDGEDYWIDGSGSFWRALSFIGNGESFDVVRDNAHAQEVGRSLGIFHSLLSDLPVAGLADTLKGFHILPQYLEHYDRIRIRPYISQSEDVLYCHAFILSRRECADMLEKAKEDGVLRLQPIHGDPKVNNILIDSRNGKAVGIVDLDTIKPGLIHYDIGDCLRSVCNPEGEETRRLEDVRFDTDLCRFLLKGYLQEAGSFLTSNDFAYLYDSVRLISFELGLRFFTDYLEGDTYFKVTYPGQNLMRALVQFRLAKSIEEQESSIRKVIGSLK